MYHEYGAPSDQPLIVKLSTAKQGDGAFGSINPIYIYFLQFR